MIKKTDLILNSDGSIYHLRLLPGDIASTIILVGDPSRVALVSKYFQEMEIQKQNREFICHTGRINGFRVSVISTGIGTDNIDIVLNELDALHNIDFGTYQIKDFITKLTFIRIGTSGAIQADIPLDTLLVSNMAIGFDALGSYYKTSQNKNCIDTTNAFLYKLSTLTETERMPYLCHASEFLLEKAGANFISGITVTMPGFYTPQGRELRAKTGLTKNLISFLSEQSFQGQKITNIEMETAAIYLLAEVLGHNAISFNAILANRVGEVFSSNSESTMKQLIEKVLETYFS